MTRRPQPPPDDLAVIEEIALLIRAAGPRSRRRLHRWVKDRRTSTAATICIRTDGDVTYHGPKGNGA